MEVSSLKPVKSALDNQEIIVYRDDGNRSVSAEIAYEKAFEAAKRIGVARVSKISQLINSPIPIYASSRPQTNNHYLLGPVSGALGKGSNDLQSKLSCLMETIEYACMENIPNNLVRSTFSQLSLSEITVSPSLILRPFKDILPNDDDDQIMWTKAFCPHLNADVFVPAETIYFPFNSEDFNVRRFFSSGTNGAASGSTYLEAIIHALYELIERAFIGGLETGMAFKTPLDLAEYYSGNDEFKEFSKNYKISFYLIESFLLPNIPVIECTIVANNNLFVGHGCAFDSKIAIDRSLAEAIQSLCAYTSGSREDVSMVSPGFLYKNYSYARKEINRTAAFSIKKPERVSLESFTYNDLLSRFKFLFTSLNEEYSEIVKYLCHAGHPVFFICNLTNPMIDLPVVKVTSPSLINLLKMYSYNEFNEVKFTRLNSYRYRNIHPQMK
jgi:YcaO-like protein with predicted kinase domain